MKACLAVFTCPRFLRAKRRPFADTRPPPHSPLRWRGCLCVRTAAIRGDRAPARGGVLQSPVYLFVCPRFARLLFAQRGNHDDRPATLCSWGRVGQRGYQVTKFVPGLGSVCSCADRHAEGKTSPLIFKCLFFLCLESMSCGCQWTASDKDNLCCIYHPVVLNYPNLGEHVRVDCGSY